MRIRGKKMAVLALAATFLSVSISSLAEEIDSRKFSVLEVTGDSAYIQKGTARKLKAIKGMGLGHGNQVGTGEDSTVYIEADGDKVIRLDENSLVDITKASAKSLNLTLRSGKLFFNVDKPLAADEEMVFKASHTSMSIRGTSGVLNYNPLKMEFFLIEGAVNWDLGDGTVVDLNAGETIVLERDLEDVRLGPALPVVYHLTKKAPFQWTDLDEDGLEAVMENRAQLNLTAIGLDTPEEIQEAADKVEQYRNSQKPPKYTTNRSDDDNDDDYDYEEESSEESSEEPSEESSEEPSIASDSDAEEPTTEEPTTEAPKYYESRTDGPQVIIQTDEENYNWIPYETGTYVGMKLIDEWNWIWVNYNETYGTWEYDETTEVKTWVWNDGAAPEWEYQYMPVSKVEALIATE